MKILHVCLAAFYIDDYGYQENILPKMHKIQGHQVSILASTETYINNFTLGYVKSKKYVTNENIPIVRIPYVNYLPNFLVRKLRLYKNVYYEIFTFKPDIIFIHDLQFLSIFQIVKYAKQNKNLTIIIDCHTDYINSARNWFSKYVLHKIIYRMCAMVIMPYVKIFYGVLPARELFLHEVYKIPKDKIKFLPLGADLTNIDLNVRDDIRRHIREKHFLKKEDFVIITGGKIDRKKNIHLLIDAITDLDIPSIKLFIFGKIDSDLINFELLNQPNIIYLEWLTSSEISNYFLASDLSCFPGGHSVLWEQSIALGLPGIFKKWPGMSHIDLGGNVSFLDDLSNDSIKNAISNIYNNKQLYNKMRDVAIEKGFLNFSYYEIAKNAINI
jgi:glycosyltransferase involved in cell wall biosynthesis